MAAFDIYRFERRIDARVVALGALWLYRAWQIRPRLADVRRRWHS